MKPGTNPRTRTDIWLMAAFCGFLFFYGLGSFGLLGADEPRYAQVAREMLAGSNWVTPTLLGKPWLEKPVLYYWEAMLSFRAFGVSDRAARAPAAVDTALLIVAIYFFLRRFRPSSELDGTLIAASCAGVIGFAHAAATDMPLAACFAIALLAWYAWYESSRRVFLAVFYVFLALGTLAKGPVAPALSAVIIFIFVAVKREWHAIPRMLWIPGIALYLGVMLPWYIAVQLRNPEFFRVFILEHNLARFSTDVYHHRQPFWFYLPVFLLATMPWTSVVIFAVVERVRLIWAECKERGRQACFSGDHSWPLFLLIWMLVPVLFFSISQSKLPGYILPAVPAGALLAAEYLAARRRDGKKVSFLFATAHGLMCGLLLFAALCADSVTINRQLVWGSGTWFSFGIAVLFAVAISAALLSRYGLRLLTRATMIAVVISLGVIVRFAAPDIDATQSVRFVAEKVHEGVQGYSHEPFPVALYRLNRVQEYGLEFYFNRPTEKYEDGNVPAEAHVLVAVEGRQSEVAKLVPGRRVSFLINIPEQKLDLYWVK